MVAQLSGTGAESSQGTTLTRENFIRGISYAESSDASDTANINLTPAEAAIVANHFFSEGDEISYADFLNEVMQCQMAQAASATASSALGLHSEA